MASFAEIVLNRCFLENNLTNSRCVSLLFVSLQTVDKKVESVSELKGAFPSQSTPTRSPPFFWGRVTCSPLFVIRPTVPRHIV